MSRIAHAYQQGKQQCKHNLLLFLCIFLIGFVAYMGSDRWKELVTFHMNSVDSPFYADSKLGSCRQNCAPCRFHSLAYSF